MLFDQQSASVMMDLFAYPDWCFFPPGLIEGQLGHQQLTGGSDTAGGAAVSIVGREGANQ